MNQNFRKTEPEPQREPKQTAGWLPAVLWAAALLCVGFMGIVIAQRTAVIRGTEVTQSSSAENS